MIRYLLCAALTVLYACPSMAGDYPTRPIRMVVTYAPGGITDNIARLVAMKMNDELGEPVVVENKSGGNGVIGTDFVAKALPDGYTILFGASGPMAANVSLMSSIPYDPITSFKPVALIAESSVVLVVRADSSLNSVEDVIKAAKEKPGQLTFGSSGTGAPTHLSGELLKELASIDLTHVPYKGDSQALNDLLGGQIAMSFPGTASALSLIKAGKLKALAVSSATRNASLPDVPTIGETVPGYDYIGWFAIFVPSATPPDVVERLRKAALDAITDVKIKNYYADFGIDMPKPLTPSQVTDMQQRDIAKIGRMVKFASIPLQ